MTANAFDEAFEKVKNLAATFKANESRYLSPEYQEAEARKDFIDKFFMALGWDVNHEDQTNPYAQEVKVERASGGPSQRRADYAFYLAPNFRDVRFYVEAKKPHGDIATPDNYFQTIRYGYGSNNPLAVLTDFEQFHVLDCRYRPDIDTATHRSEMKFHYSQYSEQTEFAKIYWLFSREAVASGSIENYAKGMPRLRGKAVQRGLFPAGADKPLDESLLEQLDEYRKKLARTFKNRNPKLDSETLTEITQRTLDRLVFLRFLEDKQIETPSLVEKFGAKGSPWEDFIAASRRLDGIYNGVVFKKHEILDAPAFRADEDTFGDICEALAHINSPYNFDAIPIHILGSIYERFLGKVIVATGKRADVEDKPEVRQARGVYYTPEYIVRYIVENTVGKLISGKTPEQIAEMRFGDIACGSGSFLLGVYDLLLSYHGKYYNENPGKARKGDCIDREGKLFLSLRKKREILLNNIYGVDIDSQAVEVCQLSLYLKLLEDETTATAHQYLLEFEHTARLKKLLPDLSKNIVCGNSLIGTDILEGQLFPREEEHKLNPMNFEDAFPEIMKRGGFDAVVGNPPYIRIQTMQETSPASVEYLANRFRAAARGNYDIYVVFAERALSLLNSQGKLGYILPHKFFNSQYGAPLRQLLAEGKNVSQAVHFGAQQVFVGATTYTCLLFLDKSAANECRFVRVNDLDEWQKKANGAEYGMIPAQRFSAAEWSFNIGKNAALCERLRNMPVKLGDAADIFVGLQTSADDVFILDLVKEKRQTLRMRSKFLGADCTLEKGLLFPLVSGTDVRRYGELPHRQYIIFPYQVTDKRVTLVNFDVIRQKYPKTAAYLFKSKKRLEQRENGKMKGSLWYGYIYLKNMTRQSLQKLCVPRLVDRLHAAWDVDGGHYLDNVDVGGVTLKPEYHDQGLLYLLALLNSHLLAWYFPFVSAPFRGGWLSANRQFLSQLPFRPINFSDPSEKQRHEEIVAKVEAMLEAKKEFAKAKTDKDKTYYENKCASLDNQIDRLVYDLYGLTEEEIRIVEGSTPAPSTNTSESPLPRQKNLHLS